MVSNTRSVLIILSLIGFFSVGVGGAMWSGERFEKETRERWLATGKTDAINLTDAVLTIISEAELTLRAVAGRLDGHPELSPDVFEELVIEVESWNLSIEFDSLAYVRRVSRNERRSYENTTGNVLTVVGKLEEKSPDSFESFVVRLTSDETGWFQYNTDLETHPAMSSVMQTAHRVRNKAILGPAFKGPDGAWYVLIALAVDVVGQSGILAATINLTKFFTDLETTHIPEGLQVRLIERDNSEARAENLFHPIIGSESPPANAVATELVRFTRGQARWDLNWDIMPEYRGGYESRFAKAIRLGGAVLTALITILIGFFAFQNARISRLVDERTDEIRLTMEKAEAAENLSAKAFQSSPALFAIASPVGGRHFQVNDAWSTVTGYSREEALERTVSELNVWGHMDERKKFVEQVREQGVVQNYEAVFKSKHGVLKDMLLSGEFIDYQGDSCLLIVGQDITERKEIDRMKGEFVSTVSHELRTPLTAIRGSLGLIKGGVVDNSEMVTELVSVALDNTERVIVLVNDLLDMEKLQHGELDFDMAITPLIEIVTGAIAAISPMADEHKITIEQKEILPDVSVKGDKARLAQVMANLLSNAVKFSPETGVVEVSMTRLEGNVRVSVSDHGPGVPEEFRSKLFDRFTQADASDTRQKGGTGLGLSISRIIVEKHGGTIALDTEVASGATFFFILPAV